MQSASRPDPSPSPAAGLARAPLLHASLAVDDLSAAGAFFREVLGYETAFEARGLSHQIARMTGEAGLVCDLLQLSRAGEGVVVELVAFRPSPLGAGGARVPSAHLAFAVGDLEAALERALGAGARLLGEVVAFSEGRSAYLAVPGGAVIELEELTGEGPA